MRLAPDEGSLSGVHPARHPRRISQLGLSLAVVAEMSGKLEVAARWHETLVVDDRLSGRDRARPPEQASRRTGRPDDIALALDCPRHPA